jgi:hypothetical protein
MEISCPHNPTGCVIHDGNPSRLAARINLHPKWFWLFRCRNLQDDGKWVFPEDSGLFTAQKLTCFRWMDWIYWLPVCV